MSSAWRYCPLCAGALVVEVPPGDDRPRHVCRACERVHYVNPRIVVGSVATTGDGRILLCRRAIPPQVGLWTLPAGFLELGESTEEGARREAREEACAELQIRRLLAVYDLRHISQVQLFYAAELRSEVAPGPESQEVGLFAWEELPWEELAFPSVRWALRYHQATRGQEGAPPDRTPPDADAQRLR